MKIILPKSLSNPEYQFTFRAALVIIVYLVLLLVIALLLSPQEPETITLRIRFPESEKDTTWYYDPNSKAATNSTVVKPLNAEGRMFLITNAP